MKAFGSVAACLLAVGLMIGLSELRSEEPAAKAKPKAIEKKKAEKKGSNEAAGNIGKKAEDDAEAVAVAQLDLAGALIDFGRANKAPEALITAARILAMTATSPLEAKPEEAAIESSASKEGEPKEEKTSTADNSPEALLNEAKALSEDDPHVTALADAVADMIEQTRGAVGGAKVATDRLDAYSYHRYTVSFYADEYARVAVNGDGDTDLDMYIYDENGNLIVSDTGYSDRCFCEWVPRWTGVFTIEIRNIGGVWNQYNLATN